MNSPAETYRGMDAAALDIAYNNRAVVPDWEGYLARWTDLSAEIYTRATARDLRYGDKPRHRLDLFLPADREAPVCLFLHGGYWQWNDKEGQAFVAKGMLDNGFGAAIGEYSLAPGVSMQEICDEAQAQVSFLAAELIRRGHGGPVYVSGISTGAHLMATVLGHEAVRGALLISGIYDLEPIRISSLNAPIGMDWQMARACSPLHRIPQTVPPVLIAYGADERPEIIRQSEDYALALSQAGHDVRVVPVPATDHFSVLETLSDASGILAKELVDLLT